MTKQRRGDGSPKWRRSIAGGALLGLFLLLSGDGTVHSSIIGGVDPLEVLKLQVKNNVLFIVDTSLSMIYPTTVDPSVPPRSTWGTTTRKPLLSGEAGVKSVVEANRGRSTSDWASYNVLNSSKTLASGSGPFVYVSKDANAAVYYNTQVCTEPPTATVLLCRA